MTGMKVECGRQHPVLQGHHVADAVWFSARKLGFERGFACRDRVEFAGVNWGGAQSFSREGVPQPAGVAFVVGDADASRGFHVAPGVEVHVPLDEWSDGPRDGSVRDLSGCELRFGHFIAGFGDPVMVERVDVPVRLEERPEALLTDLAAMKRMSVSSDLEGIFLLTCEPMGDGVASPRTARDPRLIQELKAKQGIDYDCDASDRFIES